MLWRYCCSPATGVFQHRMKLDEMTTALRETSKALQNEKRKTEELLHQMMPKKIARQLTSGQVVKAGEFVIMQARLLSPIAVVRWARLLSQT